MVDHVAVVVDGGPPQAGTVNLLYASVRICAPGSATACQTLDHVQVDTGSSGLRVLASALGSGVSPSQLGQATDANGNAIVECTQFADGYSWGPVKVADVQIGGETAHNLPIQVIGDPQYPSSLIPASCINLPNAEEDTQQKLGANGILGIGNFLQDCGPYCAQAGQQDGSAYNSCSLTAPASCQPLAVDTGQQVANPIASFAVDNNGASIRLPSVDASGAASVSGTLTFGIGTRSDNGLGSAKMYTLDPDFGTLVTTYGSTVYAQSAVDSGSNAYFFEDSGIPLCPKESWFYCPAATTTRTAQLQGQNGLVRDISFQVGNPDTLPATDTVDPSLAGPTGSTTPQSFIWGLPFFLGRSVYVVLEDAAAGGTRGPAIAF